MKSITSKDSRLAIHNPADEWERAYMRWLVEDVPSKNSRDAYNRAWEQFKTFTGKHYSDIDTEDVGNWKVHLKRTITRSKKPMEPATINQKLSAISSFYRFINLRYTRLRGDNPAESIKQLTVKPYGKSTILVNNQDVELLNSIDQSSFEGLRDYAIILLFLTTGVRLAAIANATMEHVRRQGAVMFFHYIGKGGEARQKQLSSQVAKVLSVYIQARGQSDGSLFWLKRYQIQYMIVKRCDDVFGEGHGISVHSLRHTAAVNASKLGSIQGVQNLLDHKSTRVTDIYLDHVGNGEGDKLSELLGARYS